MNHIGVYAFIIGLIHSADTSVNLAYLCPKPVTSLYNRSCILMTKIRSEQLVIEHSRIAIFIIISLDELLDLKCLEACFLST
jgi:hypothetical protein